MQVVITGRHVTLTPREKEHLEKKAGKLTRYYDRIQRIDVLVEKTAAAFVVEVLVNAEHRLEFVATASADEVYAAMDAVMDKLERQLSSHKERFRNRKHPKR